MTGKLSLIVAMDENRVIGRGNDLPWHISEDLKHFKALTTGKPVIMGRKTFDSILSRIGKPLPNRPNYIISRNPLDRDDIIPCTSLDDAIEKARSDNPDQEIMIIGGASIYEQAAPLVERIYLTQVHAIIEGADAWFPAWNKADWQEMEKTSSSDENWSYSFITLEKET